MDRVDRHRIADTINICDIDRSELEDKYIDSLWNLNKDMLVFMVALGDPGMWSKSDGRLVQESLENDSRIEFDIADTSKPSL